VRSILDDRRSGARRPRAWRPRLSVRALWAGAIGQRLYLAAEALGLGATGIGAFYDEEVQRHLNLTPEPGQVMYHFAIGYPVSDPRLEA
jgi:nitroreductase